MVNPAPAPVVVTKPIPAPRPLPRVHNHSKAAAVAVASEAQAAIRKPKPPKPVEVTPANQAVNKVSATVLSKRIHDYEYFLLFELPSGEQVELQVMKAVFASLSEQDQGLLHYNEVQFGLSNTKELLFFEFIKKAPPSLIPETEAVSLDDVEPIDPVVSEEVESVKPEPIPALVADFQLDSLDPLPVPEPESVPAEPKSMAEIMAPKGEITKADPSYDDPAENLTIIRELRMAKQLLDEGLISEEDYSEKKKQILKLK
jgi:hypothetical protein